MLVHYMNTHIAIKQNHDIQNYLSNNKIIPENYINDDGFKDRRREQKSHSQQSKSTRSHPQDIGYGNNLNMLTSTHPHSKNEFKKPTS